MTSTHPQAMPCQCGRPRHPRATQCHECRDYTPPPAVDRVADRVKVDANGCWLWQGCRNPSGYGQIRVDRRNRLVHRVTYEHFVGPIPEGFELDHLCCTRACCNPDHLEPVTRRENVHRSDAMVLRLVCASGHDLSDPANVMYMSRQRRCRPCFVAYKRQWRTSRRSKGLRAS
jgi:hypothetical protein